MIRMRVRELDWCVLRGEVRGVTGDAVFVGAAVNFGDFLKIAMRWRSRGLPFEGSCLPGIVGFNFFTVPDAVEQIDDEGDLGQAEPHRRPENVSMDLKQVRVEASCHASLRIGIIGSAVRHAAEHALHALSEHRLENQIHEDQG